MVFHSPCFPPPSLSFFLSRSLSISRARARARVLRVNTETFLRGSRRRLPLIAKNRAREKVTRGAAYIHTCIAVTVVAGSGPLCGRPALSPPGAACSVCVRG